MNETKNNTRIIETIVDLKRSQTHVQDSLNKGQSKVVLTNGIPPYHSLTPTQKTADYSGPQTKEIEERNRLIALVNRQGDHIAALKEEIEGLIRKPAGLHSRVVRGSGGRAIYTGKVARGASSLEMK